MNEDGKEWLAKAHHDFTAAKKSYELKIYDWACFQCQQSVEKALKYVFIRKNSTLIKTHDLVFLGGKVGLPEYYIDKCKELTVLYLIARYPENEDIKDLGTKVHIYLDLAQEILQWAEKE